MFTECGRKIIEFLILFLLFTLEFTIRGTKISPDTIYRSNLSSTDYTELFLANLCLTEFIVQYKVVYFTSYIIYIFILFFVSTGTSSKATPSTKETVRRSKSRKSSSQAFPSSHPLPKTPRATEKRTIRRTVPWSNRKQIILAGPEMRSLGGCTI